MEIIRPPAVAGMFYPANPYVLRNMVEQDIALEACPKIENLLDNFSLRTQLATFSPVGWESLSKPTDSNHHLKKEGRNTGNYWSQDLRAYRYTSDSFLITLAY